MKFKPFSKLTILSVLLAALATLMTNARADIFDAADIGAGYDQVNKNSYFTISNNSNDTLSNLVFTASDVVDGWNNSWSVADVAGNGLAIDYFTGSQAFQSDFNASYAYQVTPGDISYTLSGDLANQAFQLTFSTDNNASGYFIAFLGLDAYGNNLGTNDYNTVASLQLTVPEPSLTILYLIGFSGLAVASRRRGHLQLKA